MTNTIPTKTVVTPDWEQVLAMLSREPINFHMTPKQGDAMRVHAYRKGISVRYRSLPGNLLKVWIDGAPNPHKKGPKPEPKRMTLHEIEKWVITTLVEIASDHGYTPCTVYDPDKVEVSNLAEVLDAVFAVDDCRLYFSHPSEAKKHCAVIVLGNGWECLSDASIGPAWDMVMAAVDRAIERKQETL